MTQESPSERDDRHRNPLGAFQDLLARYSAQGSSQASAQSGSVDRCGRCDGRIALEFDAWDLPYWRHLDLADLDVPHEAYRDELAADGADGDEPE
jgi:hypothetical protein